jgi:eukaryotic-like serine/threonine-protein kinase
VIGALTASSLLGGNGDESAGSNNAGQNNAKQNNAQGGGNAGPSGGNSGSDQGQGGGQQQGAASTSVPEQGGLMARAAEQTVKEFYTTTSKGDYDRSAQLLTEDWRRRWFPNRVTFEGTFDKVESVVFIEGPNAELSGNTATVTGETQAKLTGETQHNQGTWYLVREGEQWKIDGWDVVQLSSRSTSP